MSVRWLILVVSANTVFSMLLLKTAVAKVGPPRGLATLPTFFIDMALSPLVYASLALQVTGYALWMLVIAQERLGVAVALSGASFYVLTALLAWWLFGERLAFAQWLGIALITAGVLCMAWRS